VEIERRLIDGIDEAARKKADGERLAGLQGKLTSAFSEMQAVLTDGEVLKAPPFEAEHHRLERPSTEMIDEAAAERADRGRLTDVQVAPTPVVSEMQTITTDVEPPGALFDDADDTFVRHLLRGTREPALPEDPSTSSPLGFWQPISEPQTVTTGDEPLPDVFDAEDDTFVRDLMKRTSVAAPEGTDDGEPLQELPKTPPSPEEDS
jgi:hypothetical protein